MLSPENVYLCAKLGQYIPKFRAQDFVMSDFSLILVLQNQNKQNHQ